MPENDKSASAADADDFKIEVIKTGKTETIYGYSCAEHKITIFTKEGPINAIVWASKDVEIGKPITAKNAGGMAGGMSAGTFMYDGQIEGYPLKTEMIMNQMGMNMTIIMTVVNIDEGTIDSEKMRVPSTYDIKPFDAKSMMGQ